MESETTAAIVMAIVALLVSLMLCGYLYVNQPESTDLSGVKSDIDILDNKLVNLNKNINKIDTDCECDVDKYDIEDLEENIDDLQDDVNDLEDECCVDGAIGPQGIQGDIGPAGADGTDGSDGSDGSDADCTELRDALCDWYAYPFCL